MKAPPPRPPFPQMSLEEFKRQVQNQFAVVLSWDEVRALQKLYGDPGKLDFESIRNIADFNAACLEGITVHFFSAFLTITFNGEANMYCCGDIYFPRCDLVPISAVAQK